MRRRSGRGHAEMSEMHPPLQLLEARGLAPGVERDDLAVEDEAVLARRAPVLERARDLRELPRLVVAEARPQTGAAVRDLHDRADAVVLRLVDELRILQGRVDERRGHRTEIDGRVRHAALSVAMGAGG